MPQPDVVTFDHRTSDLFPAWLRVMSLVYFAPPPDDERLESLRARMVGDRFVAAMEGTHLVGTYRSWRTHVTAPGGAAVPAEHRRRGGSERRPT